MANVDTMGSSQSRSNESKRYSRVGDHIKFALRRSGPSTQENSKDDVKPPTPVVAKQEVTNGNHDTKTSTPETEAKSNSPATPAVRVYLLVKGGCAIITLLFQQLQRAPMPVTVPCQVITHFFFALNSIQISFVSKSIELGRPLEVARMPS